MCFQLNDSDVYFEIKEEYIAKRNTLSVTETLMELHGEYSDYFEDAEDRLYALLAIAECQINRHELTKDTIEQIYEVKDKLYTLNIMTKRALDLFYKRVDNPQNAIDHQKSAVTSHQTKSQSFVDMWQIGDVYAYKLSGLPAKSEGLSGQFCLFRKVDQYIQPGKGISWPIVYITLWQQHSYPQSEADLLNAGYLITNMHRSLRRKDKEDYRVILAFESNKQLERFQYVGRFDIHKYPKNELDLSNDKSTVTRLRIPELDNALMDMYKYYGGIVHPDLADEIEKLEGFDCCLKYSVSKRPN